jgi:hypothetical protein
MHASTCHGAPFLYVDMLSSELQAHGGFLIVTHTLPQLTWVLSVDTQRVAHSIILNCNCTFISALLRCCVLCVLPTLKTIAAVVAVCCLLSCCLLLPTCCLLAAYLLPTVAYLLPTVVYCCLLAAYCCLLAACYCLLAAYCCLLAVCCLLCCCCVLPTVKTIAAAVVKTIAACKDTGTAASVTHVHQIRTTYCCAHRRYQTAASVTHVHQRMSATQSSSCARSLISSLPAGCSIAVHMFDVKFDHMFDFSV